MVLLIGESSHFAFHCVASTANKARHALYVAWVKHQQQTGATGRVEDTVCVNVIEDVQLGEVYRDYMPMGLKPSKDERRQTAVEKIHKALGR